MKKILLILSAILVLSGVKAQYNPDYNNTDNTDNDDEEKGQFIDNVYVGGNIGLQFSGSFFLGELSPLAGYYLFNNFSVGTGLTYQFRSQRTFNNTTRTDHIYGGRAFIRYEFLKIAFVHAEIESIRWEPENRDALWATAPLVGGGIFLSKSQKGGFYFSVLYNTNYDIIESPYNSEWIIRPGFIIFLGN